ncbi:hypothetical protein [Pseudoalteromonas nigrifaciens]|uniref:hypothetical protein n=1 Tax=Pseudoalteromonas nigrifaciens TaxID=28109 RepID=UPI003FD3FAA4
MLNKPLTILILSAFTLAGCAAQTNAKLVDSQERKVSRNIVEMNLLTGELIEPEIKNKTNGKGDL